MRITNFVDLLCYVNHLFVYLHTCNYFSNKNINKIHPEVFGGKYIGAHGMENQSGRTRWKIHRDAPDGKFVGTHPSEK